MLPFIIYPTVSLLIFLGISNFFISCPWETLESQVGSTLMNVWGPAPCWWLLLSLVALRGQEAELLLPLLHVAAVWQAELGQGKLWWHAVYSFQPWLPGPPCPWCPLVSRSRCFREESVHHQCCLAECWSGASLLHGSSLVHAPG